MTTLPPHMLAQPPPDTPPVCTPPPSAVNSQYFTNPAIFSKFASLGSFRPVCPPTPLPEDTVTQRPTGDALIVRKIRHCEMKSALLSKSVSTEPTEHTSAFRPTGSCSIGGGLVNSNSKFSQFRPSSAPINPSVGLGRYARGGGGYVQRDMKYMPGVKPMQQHTHTMGSAHSQDVKIHGTESSVGKVMSQATLNANRGFGQPRRQLDSNRGQIYAPTPQVCSHKFSCYQFR